MSQINIIIVVDVDNIEKGKKKKNGIYKITNSKDCIYMHDDQSHAYYKEGTKECQLTSFASSGSLITWTLLPTNINHINDINLETIESESKIFDYNKPLIFCKRKRACSYISEDYKDKDGLYSYNIIISYKNEKYTWDPFVEVRGKDGKKINSSE